MLVTLVGKNRKRRRRKKANTQRSKDRVNEAEFFLFFEFQILLKFQKFYIFDNFEKLNISKMKKTF